MKRVIAVIFGLVGLLLLAVGSPGQASAQGADDPGSIEAGRAIYEMNCAGCHSGDGSGVPGRGRPLIGIASQGDRAKHVASITNGIGPMPAFDERLSTEEIDQVASFVRLSFVEPAAAPSETTELALTGIESAHVAIIGLAMVAGGAQLVAWSRQRSQG